MEDFVVSHIKCRPRSLNLKFKTSLKKMLGTSTQVYSFLLIVSKNEKRFVTFTPGELLLQSVEIFKNFLSLIRRNSLRDIFVANKMKRRAARQSA